MFFTPDYLFLLLPLHFYKYANRPFAAVQPMDHMGLKHASREKKCTVVNFLIFVHKNVYRIRFQKIKIGPLKGFEKKASFRALEVPEPRVRKRPLSPTNKFGPFPQNPLMARF